MSSSSVRCYCYSGCNDNNSKDLGMPQFKKVITGELGVCCQAFIRADKINVGLCNAVTVPGNTCTVLDDWCTSANPAVLYTDVRLPTTGFDGTYYEASSTKIYDVKATVHIDSTCNGGSRSLILSKIDADTPTIVENVYVWETQPNPDPNSVTPLSINGTVPLGAGDRLFLQVCQTCPNGNTLQILPYPYSWWSVTETPYFLAV